MSTAWFWILLTVSLLGTVLCWVRVIRSDDLKVFKVAGFVISAIPFLGPLLFLFLDMPPRIPEDAQADFRWGAGTTLPRDITRQLFQGNRRYIGSMLGSRRFEGAGNREFRRATRRK